jgi:hypothetical protein
LECGVFFDFWSGIEYIMMMLQEGHRCLDVGGVISDIRPGSLR